MGAAEGVGIRRRGAWRTAALLAGAAALVAGTAHASSPFYQAGNSQWRVVQPWHHTNGKLRMVRMRLSDCDMVVIQSSASSDASIPQAHQVRYRFDARDVKPGGVGIVCKPGKGNCIKRSARNDGNWSVQGHQSSLNKVFFGLSRTHTPLQCTPGYLPPPAGAQWVYRGGSGNSPPAVPDTNATRLVQDSGKLRKAIHTRACRVIDFGTTYIGEVRKPHTGASALVWSGGRFFPRKSHGYATAGIEWCQVDTGAGYAWYHNFEYLSGSIHENRWHSHSGGAAPNKAVPQGMIDAGVSYLCVKQVKYEQTNQTTGATERLTQRYIGWWRPGTSTCNTPPLRPNHGFGNAKSTTFSVLTNP